MNPRPCPLVAPTALNDKWNLLSYLGSRLLVGVVLLHIHRAKRNNNFLIKFRLIRCEIDLICL